VSTTVDDLVGRRLGPYVVVEFLDEGVSGKVYRAHDERLGTDFALKVLQPALTHDEHARSRLVEEARALLSLNHPNITRFYALEEEGDVAYIVMELLKGERLDQRIAQGPMPERQVIDLGIQLADGLAEAHRNEILHRDLKPANVMITEAGDAKLLDFGLAKTNRPSNLTDEHSVPGTYRYLAPELLAGAKHHKGSDIYAAGLILREAATGHAPAPDGRGNVRTERSPELSPRLRALLERCLEPKPEARLASARELADGLRALKQRRPWASWIAIAVVAAAFAPPVQRFVFGLFIAPAPPVQSWAVLPLEVAAADSAHAYIADGIAASLAGRLSELPSIHVIAWESSRRYPPPRPSIQRVARDLATHGLVTGRVQFDGNVVVELHFSDGPANRELGRHVVRGGLDEIPQLQRKLERAVAKRVLKLAHVRGGVPGSDRELAESAAADAYHHARFYWERRPNELFRSIEYFEQAIRADSAYAPAHAGLADAWAAVGLYGVRPPLDVRRMARVAARRAVLLDPELSSAHASLAQVLHNYEWDWEGALAEYRHAIALNPNDAAAHHGLAHLWSHLGRHDEALAEIRAAVALNPRSMPTLLAVGVMKYWARDYAGALDTLRAMSPADTSNVLRRRLSAAVLDRLGRGAEAIAELARATDLGGSPELAAALRRAHAAGGMEAALEVMIGALVRKRAAGGYVPAAQIAELHARLGRVDPAIDWLEIAFREHDTELNRLKVDPLFDPLRKDPRFADLMKRVGFMDSPS
jgi:eukaryotic-like serine/threonine-protein kinase